MKRMPIALIHPLFADFFLSSSMNILNSDNKRRKIYRRTRHWRAHFDLDEFTTAHTIHEVEHGISEIACVGSLAS